MVTRGKGLLWTNTSKRMRLDILAGEVRKET